MNYETLNIFEYNGYLTGKITVSKQPYSDTDFQKIKNWKADIIVSMTNTEEFETYDFAIKVSNYSLHWLHVAVTNFYNPNNSFNEIILRLSNILNRNERILIDCKARQTRSGMMAMRLLVEQGEKLSLALRRIQNFTPWK